MATGPARTPFAVRNLNENHYETFNQVLQKEVHKKPRGKTSDVDKRRDAYDKHLSRKATYASHNTLGGKGNAS